MSGPVTNTNGEEVRFVRIRGRVVPIKKKKQSSVAGRRKSKKSGKSVNKKEVAKGTGIFSAGIASGVFGGSVIAEFGAETRRARKESKKLFNKGFRLQKNAAKFEGSQADFLKKQAKTFTKAGARQRDRSRRLGKQGFAIGAGAIAVGGFLSAAGLRRSTEGATGEKTNLGQEAFTDLGSAAALAGATNEFGLKSGKKGKSAARALRKILSKGRL